MKSKGQLSRLGRFSHSFGTLPDDRWAQTFGTTKPQLKPEERGEVRKDYRKQKLVRVRTVAPK